MPWIMDQLVYENHATQFMQHTPRIFFYFSDQLLIAFLGLNWAKKNMSLTRDERNSHPATIFGGQVTHTQQVFNPQHNPPTSSCKGEDTIWARAHWQPASYNYRNLSLKRKWPYALHFRVKTIFRIWQYTGCHVN